MESPVKRNVLSREEEDTIAREKIAERKKKQGGKNKFLTIVHTGEGKGKTTAALGTVMRMVAHGWDAAIVQFMKNPKKFQYAEHKLEKKLEHLDVFTMGAGFTWETQNRELDIKTTLKTWKKAKELMLSGKYRLVLLDEIIYVMDYNFLDEDIVIDFLKKEKPSDLHIILTGRNASDKLCAVADLVTEMKNIKHPFEEQGILAQKGIEW